MREDLHEGSIPDELSAPPPPVPKGGRDSVDGGPGFTAVQAVIAIGGLILFAGFAFSVCQSGFPSP